jgi:hypothetical protein
MSPTFVQLRKMVDDMGVVHGELSDRLDDILDRARINADDTCYLEKTRSVEDYDRVALDTISDILSQSETDADVCRWFIAQGVEF